VYKILLHASLYCLPILLEAQTATDYFHRGAQFYIHNQKQRATNEIFTGLRLFPDDAQLKALAGLIKQEEERQRQQEQQQQKEESRDREEQQPEQNSQDQQPQQEQQERKQSEQRENEANQKKDQQQQQQQEQKEQPQQQANQSQSPQDQEGNKKDSGQGAAGKDENNAGKEEEEQAAAPGQMTPREAKQLLDTQKQDEKMLPVKPNTKRADRKRPLRDW
jgi:hypothetical protein